MPLALAGALVVGLSLGLLGSGGSILTVPILVYLLGQPDKLAIAGSLAIVGGVSLIGAVPYALKRQVEWRSVVFFGVPGMGGALLGATVARYVSGSLQLLLFALVMLLAAGFMFRGRPQAVGAAPRPAWWLLAAQGAAVGLVTGLVGVGGGFLIVPALALLGGLPMPLAVGTSLVIIALNSLVGFAEYLGVLSAFDLRLDGGLIAWFVVIGAAGSLLGRRLGARVPQRALQRAFALFLLAMGGFILWQNLPPSV